MKDSQVLKKLKDDSKFGVTSKLCRQNFEIFKNKIIERMKNSLTLIRRRTFKKILM